MLATILRSSFFPIVFLSSACPFRTRETHKPLFLDSGTLSARKTSFAASPTSTRISPNILAHCSLEQSTELPGNILWTRLPIGSVVENIIHSVDSLTCGEYRVRFVGASTACAILNYSTDYNDETNCDPNLRMAQEQDLHELIFTENEILRD